MENIGAILKEKRLLLNLSLEELSKKIKLSVEQINAIESGDISFFKDDLSYLSYYVRYYANALDIDYNDIRDLLDESINSYTLDLSKEELEKREEMHARILQHKTTPVSYSGQNQNKKLKNNFDYRSFIYIALAVLVGITLLVVLFKQVIIPAFNNDGIKDPDIPIVDKLPDETDEEPDDPDNKPDETPVSEIVIKAINDTSYEISGWTDKESSFEVTIANRTWIQFYENGTALNAPTPRIYEVGETVKLITVPKAGKTIQINFGYISGNSVSFNGEAVVFSDAIRNYPGQRYIEFTFVGGQE